MPVERADRADSAIPASPRGGRVPGWWLTSYPVFQPELKDNVTSFASLPEPARLALLTRTSAAARQYLLSSNALDEVGASYFELSTMLVEDVVRRHLGTRIPSDLRRSSYIATVWGDLAAQPSDRREHIQTRLPCVLQPGPGIFLEGWSRFFSYCAAGAATIPLVAVDWPELNRHLDVCLS
jgi:hypothetical protein